MIKIRIQDKYNTNKTWIIKQYGCGTFYVNQEIAGKMMYKRFQRTTKRHLKEVLG